jgi:D-lyxose ketol-isomerase
MKRSEINRYIEDAKAFFASHRFALPAFAHWTAEDWRGKGPEADEIRDCMLGWDLTDFGSNDFARQGLLLFTIRNGKRGEERYPKTYAEKIMIVREGQVTPYHFHHFKAEDIINRGGGNLECIVYNADAKDAFADTPVTVSCDGVRRTVPAGGKIVLAPGESITLTPRLYHTFYGQPKTGTCLIGEVSVVNDDLSDNRFHQPLPRFSAIE